MEDSWQRTEQYARDIQASYAPQLRPQPPQPCHIYFKLLVVRMPACPINLPRNCRDQQSTAQNLIVTCPSCMPSARYTFAALRSVPSSVPQLLSCMYVTCLPFFPPQPPALHSQVGEEGIGKSTFINNLAASFGRHEDQAAGTQDAGATAFESVRRDEYERETVVMHDAASRTVFHYSLEVRQPS